MMMGTIRRLGWILIAAMVSCTGNFEKYNRHPAEPGLDDMVFVERVGVLFPGMLNLMHTSQENDNQVIEQMVGNQYGGYMVTTNKWNNRNFGTFNPNEDYVAQPFTRIFHRFYANYFQVKRLTGGEGYIFAWANIIRVAVMLRVVDTYGPIPYAKAGEAVLSARYDGVREIYKSMIGDLDESIGVLEKLLEVRSELEGRLGEFDVVYRGDFLKWIRFANSMKLRMAVRIGLVDTEYAVRVMADAIDGGVITSNADNAFLPTNDNPYRKAAFDWQDLAVSATLSAYMSGWNDPRLPVYMTMTPDGKYRGVRMGIANIDKENYGSAFYSKPGFTANSPLLVYCAAETFFLKAEAALRGWISGDAKKFYEQGVRTSMEQHGAFIGDYLSVTSNPEVYTDPFDERLSFDLSDSYSGGNVTVAWESAICDVARLEAIITQKWIANYPLGFEAWSDFRRTNFPRLMPAANNLSLDLTGGWVNNTYLMTDPDIRRMVRRLPYPRSEYNENYENVRYAVENLLRGKDEFGTDIWWVNGN